MRLDIAAARRDVRNCTDISKVKIDWIFDFVNLSWRCRSCIVNTVQIHWYFVTSVTNLWQPDVYLKTKNKKTKVFSQDVCRTVVRWLWSRFGKTKVVRKKKKNTWTEKPLKLAMHNTTAEFGTVNVDCQTTLSTVLGQRYWHAFCRPQCHPDTSALSTSKNGITGIHSAVL